MILYPPERFDLNEWFILLTATTVILIVLLLPKRFPPALTAFILLFNVFLGQTVDFLIGVPPYDLYDVNDSPKYEITDFVLYFSSYPSVAYTMLHFYDKWEVKGSRVILYIGGWSFLTMGLEWAAELAHVFKYKEWRLWYSLLVYIGIYILNILALHLARYLLHKRGVPRV